MPRRASATLKPTCFGLNASGKAEPELGGATCQPCRIRGDVLPIPIDDRFRRGTCHQIGTRFECCIDLLPDHQTHFMESVAPAASDLEHPKSNHGAGFKT
jgi:hypothetical protein